MNVAFTRARSKLVIFGSQSTLKGAPIIAEFLALVEAQNWILPLLPDAHLAHSGPGATASKSKRPRGEDGATSPVLQSAKKPRGVNEGFLRGRPVLRDVVNDVL